MLTVLKITGIVLGIAVLVITVLLLLILFLPVKYEIKGKYPAGSGKKPYAHAKASWLFGLVKARAVTGEGETTEAYLSIMGIKVYDFLNERDEKEPGGDNGP